MNSGTATFFFIIFTFFLFTYCSQVSKHCLEPAQPDSQYERNVVRAAITPLELNLIQNGLVNIQEVDSSIKVYLKFATSDNILKSNLYGNFTKAYLQKQFALKLKNAQYYLKQINPGYSLIVYDAARPQYIQQLLWDSIKLPLAEKVKYVSNPRNGSLHNYGAAVDISIVDSDGIPLDMGSAFDSIGEISQPVLEWKFLANGKLNMQQIENRKLLRNVMHKAGFFNIQTEWWHFNACNRETAKSQFKLID